MEIFSEEFKAELSNQLEALTKVVEYKPKPMSDYEIAKSMDDCMDFTDNIKKERNKNNKKFKLDDVVYIGNLQGRVKEVENTSKSIKESLLELKNLLEEELITLSEYESKRSQILSNL
jgi:hypothetical protein